MMIVKTSKLQDVTNKGQRAVVVGVLAKLSAPIDLEQLTKKVVATGQYNGKGTKGHVNQWAQEKAGGDVGSVRYHVNALKLEKRVTVTDGVAAKPKTRRKPKAEAEAPAPKVNEHAGEEMEPELTEVA